MEPVLPNPEMIPQNIQGSETVSVDASMGGQGAEVAPNKAGDLPKETMRPQQTQPVINNAVQQVATDDVAVPADDSVVATTSSDDDTPAIAEDVDVIEKEWVNKARKIVNSTKDNPYKQEEEVSRLQSDYLMKRYGKQIKSAK